MNWYYFINNYLENLKQDFIYLCFFVLMNLFNVKLIDFLRYIDDCTLAVFNPALEKDIENDEIVLRIKSSDINDDNCEIYIWTL